MQPRPAQSPSRGQLAAEALDGHKHLRDKLGLIAEHIGEWAGIPMPLEDEALVVEPTWPKAKELMAMCAGAPKPDAELDGMKVRNTFWSSHLRSDVHIIEEADGKITCGITPGANHLAYDLRTMGCSAAWGIEQESAACKLLGTLVQHHTFKMYLMTGMFLETSKRSGITYFFRRLKPTVALCNFKGEMKILCALCLHPIAFYSGSWAGAMTPTDDVVSHLTMMRGDEAMLWRRANQHPAWRPEAGL